MAKGSGFLKVTGILMIIFGAIALLISLIAMVGISALSAVGVNSTLLWVAGIFSVASATFEMVAGIIGVKNCKNPAKANTCMAWGIVVAGMCLLGQILNVAGGSDFNVVSLLIGLVLPVLYIIGAAKNKQQ